MFPTRVNNNHKSWVSSWAASHFWVYFHFVQEGNFCASHLFFAGPYDWGSFWWVSSWIESFPFTIHPQPVLMFTFLSTLKSMIFKLIPWAFALKRYFIDQNPFAIQICNELRFTDNTQFNHLIGLTKYLVSFQILKVI